MTPNGPAITPPAHHTPSRKDARTNRERILTAARSAFAASSSASLSAIARQAGVGIGTLYRHFDHGAADGSVKKGLDPEDVLLQLSVLSRIDPRRGGEARAPRILDLIIDGLRAPGTQ